MAGLQRRRPSQLAVRGARRDQHRPVSRRSADLTCRAGPDSAQADIRARPFPSSTEKRTMTIARRTWFPIALLAVVAVGFVSFGPPAAGAPDARLQQMA